MRNMKNNQSGFTLIELVMVIVILGILSAFALPRFADLGGDARRATIEGAYGAMRSASAIVHSAALANGTNPATIDLEGETINLTNNYPDGSASGITLAAGILGADYTITPGATPATAAVTIDAIGAITPATCRVSYTPAAAGAAPVIEIVDTAGC